MSARRVAAFRHYGIAPFEVEALYSILNGSFSVVERKVDRPEVDDYACMIDVSLPLDYNATFIESFGRKQWGMFTFLIKEMRRRTGKKGVRLVMHFTGKPALSFTIAMFAENLFEEALEKLEILDELVSLQLDSGRLPGDVNSVQYEFDAGSGKWHPSVAEGDGRQYSYDNGSWLPFRNVAL